MSTEEQSSSEPDEATGTAIPLGSFAFCPECSTGVPVSDENFHRYFSSDAIICPHCESTLDWWEIVVRAIREKTRIVEIYSILGAHGTAILTTITAGRRTEIDLAKHGVPEGATLLGMTYTAVGSKSEAVYPLEWHGSTPIRDYTSLKFTLFGIGIGSLNPTLPPGIAVFGQPGESAADDEYPEAIDDEQQKATNDDEPPKKTGAVQLFSTWIETEEISTLHLIDAIKQYNNGHNSAAVVPANIAVESALTPVLYDALASICGSETAEEFLEKGATYSYQLKVIIPMITYFLKIPEIPSHVQVGLNRLRKLRNDMAHRGRPMTPVDNDAAASLLAASIFGYQYTRFLAQHIVECRQKGQLPSSKADIPPQASKPAVPPRTKVRAAPRPTEAGSAKIPMAECESPVRLRDLVVAPQVDFFSSKKEAAREIKSGAVSINDEVCTDPEFLLTAEVYPSTPVLLKRGKKKSIHVIWRQTAASSGK